MAGQALPPASSLLLVIQGDASALGARMLWEVPWLHRQGSRCSVWSLRLRRALVSKVGSDMIHGRQCSGMATTGGSRKGQGDFECPFRRSLIDRTSMRISTPLQKIKVHRLFICVNIEQLQNKVLWDKPFFCICHILLPSRRFTWNRHLLRSSPKILTIIASSINLVTFHKKRWIYGVVGCRQD